MPEFTCFTLTALKPTVNTLTPEILGALKTLGTVPLSHLEPQIQCYRNSKAFVQAGLVLGQVLKGFYRCGQLHLGTSDIVGYVSTLTVVEFLK